MLEPRDSQGKVSHLWSCTTLGDGLKHVDAEVALGAGTCESDEEAKLLAQLKEIDDEIEESTLRASQVEVPEETPETIPATSDELEEAAKKAKHAHEKSDSGGQQLPEADDKESAPPLPAARVWHSESELKELGWTAAKIQGAKSRCMALGDSHTRRNAYDGELEFFVVLSEKAKRTEESSYEEEHRKRQKVDHDPSSDLGTNFSALDARATREAEEKKKQVETPQVTKYLQTKETLKKFLTSMMSKAGKLRHLVRDLKKSYSDSATATCLKTLEMHIADVDKHYDGCNESWARGEVEDFGTEEWYKQAEQRMKDATFVCAKATAYETKIRNAKKYYEKKGPAEQHDGIDHELPKKKKESEKEPKKNKKDKKSKKNK